MHFLIDVVSHKDVNMHVGAFSLIYHTTKQLLFCLIAYKIGVKFPFEVILTVPTNQPKWPSIKIFTFSHTEWVVLNQSNG